MRVAAIDVGTNSTRLLIAEAYRGSYRDLDRRLLFTRLGQGVDADRRLAAAAIKRTLKAVAEFCSVCGEFGVQQIQVAGTSAVRDAANSQEFLELATRLAGRPAVALSGAEEADLSFAGATGTMVADGALLVCDIGGGSTEFVTGSAAGGVTDRMSLNMGSVRMTERFLASDPPETGELLLLEGTVDGLLEEVEALGNLKGSRFVGLGGTITTLGALAAGLDSYSMEKVDGLRVSRKALDGIYADLARMTTDQRASLPIMPPGRADVVVAGASILSRTLSRLDFERVIVSERDILDGLVMQMLGA